MNYLSFCRAVALTLLPLCALTLPVSAQQVTELCNKASSCSVMGSASANKDALVTVVWRGRAVVENVGDLMSKAGFFQLTHAPTDKPLGASRVVLSRILRTDAAGQAPSFSIKELVTVPAHIVQAAIDNNAKQLYYVRRFTLNGAPAVRAVQTIKIAHAAPPIPGSVPAASTPTASGLQLQRLALHFTTGTQAEVIGKNQKIRVVANILYDRAGVLDAVWEIATPATTSGQPVFHSLANVHQYLGSGHSASIQSPLLPSGHRGLYQVRLRLRGTANEKNQVMLQYQVGETALKTSARVKTLSVMQPLTGASLTPSTEFRWHPVAGTQAYQLEIYTHPPQATHHRDGEPAHIKNKPTTGILLASNTTHTTLSATAFQYLQAGQLYYWRVIAIDDKGAVTAASRMQKITAPQ